MRGHVLISNYQSGLEAAEKKFGQGKIDPQNMQGTNEKIADGARSVFEKVTGCVKPSNPPP